MVQIHDCDDLTNLSVLNAAQATEGADIKEGIGSWKITGDAINWYSYGYLNFSSTDFTATPKIKMWAKYATIGSSGEEVLQLIDSDGDKISWLDKWRTQLSAGNWVEAILNTADYDSETGTFDITKCVTISIILRNATASRVYYFDDFRRYASVGGNNSILVALINNGLIV